MSQLNRKILNLNAFAKYQLIKIQAAAKQLAILMGMQVLPFGKGSETWDILFSAEISTVPTEKFYQVEGISADDYWLAV